MTTAPPNLIIAIDIDGVLANFNSAFERLLNDLHATEITLPKSGPSVWDWPTHYGWTPSQAHAAWEHIQENGEWWLDLDPTDWGTELLDTLIMLRHQDVVVYFVTARKPLSLAQEATTAWLEAHGFGMASVIVQPPGVSKAQIFAALGAKVVVDDKPSNCSPACVNLLVDHDYNRDPAAWPEAPWGAIRRVNPGDVAQELHQTVKYLLKER